MKRSANAIASTHKLRRRGAEGCSSPKLGRNPFHSGKYSERTIGNLVKFSGCSPALSNILDAKFTVSSLALTSFYAHADTYALSKLFNKSQMADRKRAPGVFCV